MPKSVMTDWLDPSPEEWTHDGVTWHVTLQWADLDGFVECVGLAIEPADGNRRILGAAVMRALPFGKLVREARRKRYQKAGGDALEAIADGVLDESPANWMTESSRPWGKRSRRRATRLDDEHYAEVARIYSAAALRGSPPGKAVGEAMHASRPTVSRWLAEARNRGLLPPTTQGRARAGMPENEEEEE